MRGGEDGLKHRPRALPKGRCQADRCPVLPQTQAESQGCALRKVSKCIKGAEQDGFRAMMRKELNAVNTDHAFPLGVPKLILRPSGFNILGVSLESLSDWVTRRSLGLTESEGSKASFRGVLEKVKWASECTGPTAGGASKGLLPPDLCCLSSHAWATAAPCHQLPIL